MYCVFCIVLSSILYISDNSHTMAKGKHAPTKGAIREEKVLHPTSRKVLKMARKETHRYVKHVHSPIPDQTPFIKVQCGVKGQDWDPASVIFVRKACLDQG